jgi:Zn-dependent protease
LFGSLIQAVGGNVGVALLVLEIVVFISILVHELGHAFAFRFYGTASHIVLYWLGGLAIPGMGSWSGGRTRSVTPYSQIVISLAGPIAGFTLAGVMAAAVYGLGGEVNWSRGPMPMPIPDFSETPYAQNQPLFLFFFTGLWCNIFWNVLNLIPVFPLDGGQVARQIFLIADPWGGLRNSIILSTIAAGAVAFWGISSGNMFMGIFFGFMAFESFQSLNSPGGRGGNPW